MGRPVKPGEKPNAAELEMQLPRYPIRMVNETLTNPRRAMHVNSADKLATQSLLVHSVE
jgi:hypothetical protein